MNKKLGFSLILISLFSSCSNNEQKFVLSLINDLSLSNNYQVTISQLDSDKKESIIIDGNSFIVNQTTYYKYVFKENYQVYTVDEVEEDQVIETSYPEIFSQFFNRIYYNQNYFEIIDDVYTLKEKAYNIFDFSYFDENLISLQVLRNQNILNINLELENKSYLLEYSLINQKITPFQVKEEDYTQFYQKNEVSYSRFKELLLENDNFILIINDEKCSSCKSAEPLYFAYQCEYGYQNFYSINQNKLSKQEKKEIVEPLNNAYINQKNEYKRTGYDKYPTEYFLTPTAIKYLSGEARFLFLGLSVNDKDTFNNFCNEK